jgi:hypothetical protein
MAVDYQHTVLTVQAPLYHWSPPRTFAGVYDLGEHASAQVIYLECLAKAAKEPEFQGFEPGELVVLQWSMTPMFPRWPA